MYSKTFEKADKKCLNVSFEEIKNDILIYNEAFHE